jgi:DNA-binding transcriptional MerR regulator
MGELPPNPEALVAEQPDIPDKLFFRIGEVSQLVGVKEYVLRYWESEFPGLSPRKSSSGQRMFRRKDVELLLRIKHLLYGQKFTIEGARKALQQKTRPEAPSRQAAQPNLFAANPIVEIRKQLSEILQLLS